jgi:immune inhibitor A
MSTDQDFLNGIAKIYQAARSSDDGNRCAVAPHPDLGEKIKNTLKTLMASGDMPASLSLRAAEPRYDGFNDGLIIPPEEFPLGTAPSAIRNAAAERAPLRGPVRVIVVLVDFSDKNMTQTLSHFRDLFFSVGVLPKKSVREYFSDVTNGLIDLQGDVVGPFRLPLTLAQYAHGAAGTGGVVPNAQTMARDAVTASNPSVNFAPFDNDGNGFVDAFIVIHAGAGGEQTGNPGDIWSHKWTLDGGAKSVDGTKIFAYLTVPEDCKIGVCAHELGHLLFGFPDLYDTDNSSEGIGNWCLMAGGSWGGAVPGETPVHPSAWCKANQGWTTIDNRTANAVVSIHDVKDAHTIYRLWKDGGPGNEYFLVENRQKAGFDASLPGSGLLIWHIDESQSKNTDENHYKVALMQADGKRDMEHNVNRGDAGDPYPGTANNKTFNNTSTPNSKSYSNANTCVAVTAISASAPIMTANLQVKCGLKPIKDKEKDIKDFKEKDKEAKEKDKEKDKEKEIKDFKEKDKEAKEKDKEKDIKDFKEKDLEKPINDRPGKPVIDKSAGFDKGFDKLSEGKLADRPGGGLGGAGGSVGGRSSGRVAQLEARIAALEAALGSSGAGSGSQTEPFIGSELRPDLSQGAFQQEEDHVHLQEQMRLGSAQAKRAFDKASGQ